ncbi:MAG: RNA methyltransferase [Ignavibacteriaceae bacterium]|nr:RNA methyltransferase [Ignavibacteriaceae bacterium]HRI46881.1 RNA methyltransferase [Ignavibacteriaceae bacterium]
MKIRTTITESRKSKLIDVATKRQHSLHLVLENIHDPHNVSAIFRTCDAVGIPNVSLVYNYEKFPKIGKKSSASAFKWVDKAKYKSVEECYEKLRLDGYKIYASTLADKSVNLFDLDFTGKIAVVMGNEHRGISEEAANLADEVFFIPMFGMVQSLNVSVAAAITLYEAARQRFLEGLYNKSELSEEELLTKINEWITKK